MSREHTDWDKIEETYLEMKEQEFEQMDMSELWSRIEKKLDQSQEWKEGEKKEAYTDNEECENDQEYVKRNRDFENKETYGEKQVYEKKGKQHIKRGRKITIYGTLVAAVLLVVVSYSVMRSGISISENNGMSGTWENTREQGSQPSPKESLGEQQIDDSVSGERLDSEADTSVAEDGFQSNTQNGNDMAKAEGSQMKDSILLLCVKKQDGFYEFSVNLQKYYLQLVEISVKKKENVFALAYSDFSASVRERLQDEIADISSYDFYVDSEGVLYMEREDRYYQVHLEEKGDGFDGE